MAQVITISRGRWAATIAPRFGACLTSLRYGGVDVLRQSSEALVAKDPLNSACYICAPWFGRLFAGVSRNGIVQPLDRNHPASDAPLHGEVWLKSWRVETSTAARLVCAIDMAPSAGGFPYRYRADIGFDVLDDGFHIAVTVTNQDTAPMPVGLALHPFFNRSDNTHARLSARRIWRPPFAADEAGRETQAPAFIEAHSLQTLPADEFDNTLLSAAQPIVVETPAGAIALKANVDDWHVYAPRGERFFCIEPVTQLPGAFGARIIEPQETAALALSFSPSRDY